MKRELTCIICPRGCTLSVDTDVTPAVVTGNSCPKGETYGIEECTHPVRTVTAIMRVANREDTMVSVKTAAPIPKEHIFDCMAEINRTTVDAPVKIGQKVLTNVFGTDIIVTKKIL
ncbi:MAG: DUF1667 domain-containing protein [Clostridia bacterium]|nr:DUF1667 domain-containing protein [Clostridia bacterium]